MTIRTFFGFSVLSACLALGVQAADDASDLKVQASSDLRIAVLDLSPSSPARAALHEAFANSLSATLSKQLDGKVGIKLTEVDAFRLSFDLKAGIYDAALIVGNNVPSQLKKGDFEVLRAVSDFSTPMRVFHMVVPADDPALKGMISAAFPEVLASARFQEALTRSVAIKISPDAVKKAAKENIADTTH